jgi:hypothetical protein
MKPNFHDPNNHVPEVNPEDEWGDGETSPAADVVPAAALPVKRKPENKPAFREVKHDDDKGIEIGVRVLEKPQPSKDRRGPVQRLEVQELAPKRLVPEPVLPLPVAVPQKVVPKLIAEKVIPETTEEEEWIPKGPDAENWGRQKTVPMRWFIIAGSLLAVFVLTLAVILPKIGWKDEKRATSFFKQIDVDDVPVAPKTKSEAETFEESGRKVGLAYAHAKTVDEVLPLLRNRARVESIVRSQWKPLNLPTSWKLPDDVEWSTREAGGQEYAVMAGSLPNVTRFGFYFIHEGGKVVLDWKASAAWSEESFDALSKNEGAGGVVRGMLSPAEFYTASLPERDYLCYRIASPDEQQAIWGYVQRGTPQAEAFSGLFEQGAIPRDIPAQYQITVRVGKAPDNSLPNQWSLTEMLHIDWLTP